MKLNFFTVLILAALSATALFSSCATRIDVAVEHPPIMDMRGIEKIAVLNMDTDTRNSDGDVFFTMVVDAIFRTSMTARVKGERNAAWYLTERLGDIISNTGSLKLIDPHILRGVPRDEYPDYIDAYLNAGVSSFSAHDEHVTEVYKNNKDGEKKEVHYIDRTVSIDFWYRFIRAKDGVILNTVRKTGSATERFQKGSTPVSVNTITKGIIQSELSGMRREIVPWTSIEVYKLEKDKTKDPRLKEATNMVKAGRYRDALASFRKVYNESGNYAAGFNEAIVTAALGSLDEARILFEDLGERMGYNADIKYELLRLEKRLADIEALKDYK